MTIKEIFDRILDLTLSDILGLISFILIFVIWIFACLHFGYYHV
jgi:low affinity Fe/Cu permease